MLIKHVSMYGTGPIGCQAPLLSINAHTQITVDNFSINMVENWILLPGYQQNTDL